MAERAGTFNPDYVVSPGQVLAEMLDAREMSHAEFARSCGRSPKLISEIISGKAPVEPETAMQFERVLGMDATVWLNLEAQYQLRNAKVAEERSLAEEADWAARFPIKDLVKAEIIKKTNDTATLVREILSFFGIGTVEAWQERYATLEVSYRHSPAFKSSPEAIAVWLNLGELRAREQDCAEYDRSTFLEALRKIRSLTRLKIEEFQPLVRKHCNSAGVAFVLVQPIPGIRLSGAARWLTPRRALIQQSLRHRSNDHFWFTFFHEAAHILLHSKREVFVEEEGTKDGNRAEIEANAWAANALVPRTDLCELTEQQPITAAKILKFAEEQGIDPGIVVGMLQHEGAVDWSQFNTLKRRYVWRQPAKEQQRP
jgi:addiction module HigA family antidote